MSKIARSARVASRQRVEAITTDKTIITAESGELYLVGASTESDGVIRITLPTPEAGSYFKFLFTADTIGTVSLTGSATNYFSGRATQQLGSPHGLVNTAIAEGARIVDSPKTDNSEYKLVLAKAAALAIGSGSVVELHSNGTAWYVEALVTGSTALFA